MKKPEWSGDKTSDLNCLNCSLQKAEKRCCEGLFCPCLGFYVLYLSIYYCLPLKNPEQNWHLVCSCIVVLVFLTLNNVLNPKLLSVMIYVPVKWEQWYSPVTKYLESYDKALCKGYLLFYPLCVNSPECSFIKSLEAFFIDMILKFCLTHVTFNYLLFLEK